MGRLDQVREFIEYDIDNNFSIEPEARYDAVKVRLIDVINTYKPEVIVKAGIGNGRILNELASEIDSVIIVVEPSFKAIKEFLEKSNEDNEIKFINGDFHELPVDYYASDLLVCIDYLDFFDSSICIDEFKRALQFDGILFFSGVVLNDEDVEGVYDDFMRKIFPLHNDYYLASDLKTFLELKEFDLIKGMHLKFQKNLESQIDYYKKIFNDVNKEEALEFIETHKDDFKNIIGMDEKSQIDEPYYIGVFMRKKPK